MKSKVFDVPGEIDGMSFHEMSGKLNASQPVPEGESSSRVCLLVQFYLQPPRVYLLPTATKGRDVENRSLVWRLGFLPTISESQRPLVHGCYGRLLVF